MGKITNARFQRIICYIKYISLKTNEREKNVPLVIKDANELYKLEVKLEISTFKA